MARYEHLPIYKQPMEVAVQFERVVAGLLRASCPPPCGRYTQLMPDFRLFTDR